MTKSYKRMVKYITMTFLRQGLGRATAQRLCESPGQFDFMLDLLIEEETSEEI
jgi:hypothetical protein